jgi:hypothetical protein
MRADTSGQAHVVRRPEVKTRFILITHGRFLGGKNLHQEKSYEGTYDCNHAVKSSSPNTTPHQEYPGPARTRRNPPRTPGRTEQGRKFSAVIRNLWSADSTVSAALNQSPRKKSSGATQIIAHFQTEVGQF